jgi:hypothetical protein
MKFKFILIILGIFMMHSVHSDSQTSNDFKYIKIETLSGVEAEVIKVAVDQFNSEKLNITAHGYEVTLYLINDNYLALFERAKNASLGTIDPRYEVLISSKTFKVISSQFSR